MLKAAYFECRIYYKGSVAARNDFSQAIKRAPSKMRSTPVQNQKVASLDPEFFGTNILQQAFACVVEMAENREGECEKNLPLRACFYICKNSGEYHRKAQNTAKTKA